MKTSEKEWKLASEQMQQVENLSKLLDRPVVVMIQPNITRGLIGNKAEPIGGRNSMPVSGYYTKITDITYDQGCIRITKEPVIVRFH